MKIFISFSALLFFIIYSASAQDDMGKLSDNRKLALADSIAKVDAVEYLPSSLGVFANLNMNSHKPDFSALPGIPNCCPHFTEGSGTGFSLGALYELPFSSALSLQMRLGYFDYGGELSADENTKVLSMPQTSQEKLIDGTIRHTINAGLGAVGIEPLLSYKIAGGLNLHLGLNASFLMTKTYEQKAVIIEPKDEVVFSDGKKTHLDLSGDIPEAAGLMLSALGGISYELPMNKQNTLKLVPEVFYSMGLSNIVSTDTSKWTAGAIRLGLSVKYTPEKPEEPPVQDYRIIPSIDTVQLAVKGISAKQIKIGEKKSEYDKTIAFDGVLNRNIETTTERFRRTDTLMLPKAPELTASVDAMGVGKNGAVYKDVIFKVEEFITDSRNFPLLNYIFFDEDASVLPERYSQISKAEAALFNVNNLDVWETLPIYYNLINIVGRRMSSFPDAKIELTAISGTKTGGPELSTKRAETIRDYLKKTWNIPEERVIIKIRNEKEKPNMPLEKLAENRRVEITSSNPEILQPLFKASDTSRTVDPPSVRFVPKIISDAGIAEWKIRAVQGGRLLKELKGSGTPGEKIDWQIDREKKTTPTNDKPIEYSITATDAKGSSFTSPAKSLKVEYMTISDKMRLMQGSKSTERYNLILFDLDKSDIKGGNKKIVDFILGRIKPNSTVQITGYTDKIGNPEYNLKLSAARANSTAKALGIPGIATKGVGGEQLLFDNSLPEGRFYCRTVEVYIETPNP